MLMLTAYIDETGHSKDPRKKYVGLAGMVATAAQWEVFERDWRAALEYFEIPDSFFHMVDFAQSSGEPYKKWKDDEAKRREVYGRLMGIIRDTGGVPFGAVVRLEDYNAISDEFKAVLVDPYYVCLQHCIHGAAVSTLYEAPDEKVRVVFANHPEFRKVGQLYEVMRDSKEMAHHDLRLGGYSIEDPRDIMPLQAADVIAYEIGQYFEKFIHCIGKIPRWGFCEILRMGLDSKAGSLWLTYYGRNRLEQSQHEREVVQAHNVRARETSTKEGTKVEIDAAIAHLQQLRTKLE